MTKKKLIGIAGCIVLLLSMMVGGIIYLNQVPEYEKNSVSSNKTPNEKPNKTDKSKKDDSKKDDSKKDELNKDEPNEVNKPKDEQKLTEQKTPEQKPTEQKTPEQKPTEQKAPEQKPVEQPVSTKPTSKPSQPAPSKPASKPTQSKPTPSKPAKPQHTCTWTPIIKEVYHDAVGHYEQVLVKAAWTEERPIYGTKAVDVCNTCGQIIEGNPSDHIEVHMLKGEGGSWRTEYIQQQTGTEKIEHPAEYKQEWVVDAKAWTEQVTVGYKCNGCGKTK